MMRFASVEQLVPARACLVDCGRDDDDMGTRGLGGRKMREGGEREGGDALHLDTWTRLISDCLPPPFTGGGDLLRRTMAV